MINIDHCLAVYNEARDELDELQLIIKFPGTDTVVIETHAKLFDGVIVSTDPFIISASEPPLVQALYGSLVQALVRSLEAIRMRLELDEELDEEDEEWYSDDELDEEDEEWLSDDELEEEEDDDPYSDDDESDNKCPDSVEIQKKLQDALDEEAKWQVQSEPQVICSAQSICNKCGGVVWNGYKYCPHCGAALY